MDTGELIDINTINYPTFDIALRAKQTEEEMVTKLYNAIMGLNGKGSKGE